MPKIVDHDQRREEFVDALWRVVTRDGVGAISIRSIAAEAGVPPGLISYYFKDRAALLASAVDRLASAAEQAGPRLVKGPVDLDTAVDLVMLAIPHSKARRQQSGVWLMLLAERDSATANRDLLRELDDRVLVGLRWGLNLLTERGIVHPDRDLEVEIVRLHGLIDGLSLQSTTTPSRMTTARLRSAVRVHLQDLGRPPL